MNFLVDPKDVINYNRTDEELELFWLFCAVVAGKTASTQAALLERFLEGLKADPENGDSPMKRIAFADREGRLHSALINSRLGQYNRLLFLMRGSIDLNLRTCSLADLENVFGCGPKTARMFIMMSRPNQRVAALDTHVLKHLRANGIEAPMTTPPAGKRYRQLEEEFLKLADQSNMSVAEYDLSVWKKYAERKGG